MPDLRRKLGICQWFHYQDRETVERTAALMQDLGLRHLRTGISWADYYRPEGAAWYRWMLESLRQAGLELLVSVWHTPPSISESGSCSGPPERLKEYADFIDLVISEHGHTFDDLELWNEPNNVLKWNFRDYDPQWRKFSEMLAMAANWASIRGKRTILGGIIPVDHHWLDRIGRHGALDAIDIIAFHAFPGMWWDDHPSWDQPERWHGWEAKLAYLREHTGRETFWVTETGFATWDHRRMEPAFYQLQTDALAAAIHAPVERLYWYSGIDLSPHKAAIESTEGDWFDGHEYHLGLESWEGERKPAFHALRDWIANPHHRPSAACAAGTC